MGMQLQWHIARSRDRPCNNYRGHFGVVNSQGLSYLEMLNDEVLATACSMGYVDRIGSYHNYYNSVVTL